MNLKEMKKASDNLHRQLNLKNDYRMTEVIRYLKDRDLSTHQFETLRLELLKQAVAAEEKGKPADSAFGYDYRKAVDSMVQQLPPIPPVERLGEAFRLWGMLVPILFGISVGSDLILTLTGSSDSPWTWSVTANELVLGLLIIGLAITITSLFSRFKLERDPDFFSKKEGNRLLDFIRSYGSSLLWMLLCFGLMFLLKDRRLLTLPLPLAGAAVLIVTAVYFYILRLFENQAAQSARAD